MAAFALSDSVRYVVIVTIASVTYGITSAEDVDKAAALEQAVVSKTTAIHQFARDSATYPGRPPISVTPGSLAILAQPPQIDIYEIKDRAEQNKVIAAVQAVMCEQKLNLRVLKKTVPGWADATLVKFYVGQVSVVPTEQSKNPLERKLFFECKQ